jgi:hypothetical protein
MASSVLRGHPCLNLQLRAFAAAEATAADGEGRRLSSCGSARLRDRQDSKEPIADMSAVESRARWSPARTGIGLTVPISWTGRKFGASLLKDSLFGRVYRQPHTP